MYNMPGTADSAKRKQPKAPKGYKALPDWIAFEAAKGKKVAPETFQELKNRAFRCKSEWALTAGKEARSKSETSAAVGGAGQPPPPTTTTTTTSTSATGSKSS